MNQPRAVGRVLARLLDASGLLQEAATLDLDSMRDGRTFACWFCFRSAVFLFEPPGYFRCASSGSCRRFFVAADTNFKVAPARCRCRRCRGLLFRLQAGTPTRAAARTCVHCGDCQPLSFPLDRVGPLVDAEDRARLRASGDLSAVSGPTFAKARISDRTEEYRREAARLGTAQARDELRRYVYQRERRRRNRIKHERDGDKDARRFRR